MLGLLYREASRNPNFISRRGRVETRVERSDAEGEGVWHRCEQQLCEELSSQEYDMWIKPLQAEWEQLAA